MKKVIAYKTAAAEYLDALDSAVEALVVEGWQPFGSIAVSQGTPLRAAHYVQPMVKYADE